MEYRLQVSSSIIPFREKAERTWNIKRYKFPKDIYEPTIFFGMYHPGDYYHFLRHLGKKIVLWAGYDIVNLLNVKLPIAKLFKNAENYVENELEQEELEKLGIEAKVRPSFVEDIDDFPVSFKPSKNPHVFMSSNISREEEYGFGIIGRIAEKVPEITFHLYGGEILEKPVQGGNIILHGRVSNERFNEEIKQYHCGLRPNEHDGFSEILAKSILMGQYPISRIKYPYIDNYNSEEELVWLLKELKNKKEPNYYARGFFRNYVNNYPWVKNE